MTITVWPANAVSNSPTYAGRALRQTTNAPFLAGATATRPLGAFSGVRPGTPSTTVTATTTTVTVGPVAGTIDGQSAAEAGPYTFASDAPVSFTSQTSDPYPAANASNARKDIVCVQVNDPAESDGSSTPGVVFRYVAGVPSATPTAPAVPARSFVLAEVNVPKAGGGSPSVSWKSPYCVAAGGVVPADTKAQLDLIPGIPGQTAFVTNDANQWNNGMYRWEPTATKWFSMRTFDVLPGTVLFGSVPPAGARRIVQEGIAGVTTSGTGSGDATLTLPTPFPNGVVSAVLTRHDFNTGDTVMVTNGTTQGLDRVNFRVYQTSGAVLGPRNLSVNFSVIGW